MGNRNGSTLGLIQRIILLLIPLLTIILLNSCYTTKQVTFKKSVLIEDSKRLVAKMGVDFERIENTNQLKGNATLRFYAVNEYKSKKTNEFIKLKKFSSGKTSVLLLMPMVITDGLLLMEYGSDVALGPFFIAQTVSAFVPLIIWSSIAKKHGVLKKPTVLRSFTSQTDTLILDKEQIIGEEISLSTKNFSIQTITNAKGESEINILQFCHDYYESNDPVIIEISYRNLNCEKKLIIYPSDVLTTYFKIQSMEAPIWKNNSYSKQIGIARLGMEYEVVVNNSPCLEVKLPNGGNGFITKGNGEVFYSVPRQFNVKDAIKQYVEMKLGEWQIQGEFERKEDYLARIDTRQSKIEELVNEGMNVYQSDYSNLFSWDKATLSKYDPNRETFIVGIPDLAEIILSVPIEFAPVIKANWSTKKFKNQEYVLVDGSWKLSKLDIELPGIDYKVHYSSDLANQYDPVNQFNIKFESVNIDGILPERKIQVAEDLSELDYSINTNLPRSTEKKTDAIAIVIGNTNYQWAGNVPYAMNDAQLIKTYLVEVMGYQEGNVIYKSDATKGDMEGLFGTGEDFKGKLFNYVKKGLSEVFVYYSGHGFPGIDRKAFFLPVDCEPNQINLQGYPVDQLYANLAHLGASSVTVVVDACFSGSSVSRSVSGVRIVDRPIYQIPNGILLTASAINEEATWLPQQKHGMFTYFFLRAIHENNVTDVNKDGQLTVGEIYNYVNSQNSGVSYYARRIHQIDQNPSCYGDMNRVFVKLK